ncbi:hypothetical protein HanIR_Chr09g0399701 [Helianthus annuus]|nr:hypothetical protein HanIR_Chr09g0399701 [Helianthus annuus]
MSRLNLTDPAPGYNFGSIKNQGDGRKIGSVNFVFSIRSYKNFQTDPGLLRTQNVLPSSVDTLKYHALPYRIYIYLP